LTYISAGEVIGVSSTTFTPNSVKFRCAAVRAITLFKVIQGHRVESSYATSYYTNLASTLHRFRDIAFDRSKIAIFGYLSCVQLPRRGGGSPRTISVKFYLDVNRWPSYQMAYSYIAENFSLPSMAHERYRQTDVRSHNMSSHVCLLFTSV